jgi:hypothetical protein
MKHIFLSYSRVDSAVVQELYRKLKQQGFQLWFDEESLLPGQVWENEIEGAIFSAGLVLVLLSSKSVNRMGYAQKEIRTALEVMERMPEGRPYLVPIRLDDCAIPKQLSHIHCGMLTNERDFEKLAKTLYEYVGIPSTPVKLPINYRQFDPTYRKDPLLIIPGFSISGVRIGASPADVSRQFGKSDKESRWDDCWFLNYYRHGLSFRFANDKDIVTTIFAYHEGVDGYTGFHGQTPEGISTDSTRREVEAIFGRPSRDGGNGRINYWVGYDSIGIGFTYNSLDTKDLNAKVRNLLVKNAG